MSRFSKILFYIVCCISISSLMFGQSIKRQDAVWARSTAGAKITLDGKFDEPAWAKADSIVIVYGKSAGLPTSGWKSEFQGDVNTDPIRATVKFLVDGNQLYLAFSIPDSSIGGTKDWDRFDAILMSVKDRTSTSRPVSPAEFFYGWWLGGMNDTAVAYVGRAPRFAGTFGDNGGSGRTPAAIATWDAVTYVDGIANDNLPDKAWYTEMRVDLSKLGYDVTKPDGDVVMLNFSIWDADNVFGNDPSTISEIRACWQSPWGNVNQNNTGRIYANPSVTINSGAAPDIAPDVIIPNGAKLADPVIDGKLDEPCWQGAYTFNIAWDDTLLRSKYPGIGPYMSGQYQPELVTGSHPPILDPSYGTFKLFFKDHYLYLGADVNDQIIQGSDTYDKIDGIMLILGDTSSLSLENFMNFQELRLSFDGTGYLSPYSYMLSLVDSGYASFAYKLKGASTVNINTDVDSGYVIEAKIDLTKLGYPADLGDHLLFGGMMLADGDSFDDPANNYGSRVWWFRENAGQQSTPWMYMDPNTLITGVGKENRNIIPSSIVLNGNYPNPFNPSTKISFSVPVSGMAAISVYNSLGQLVAKNTSPVKAGSNEYNFNASNLASGVYYYQVKINGADSKIFQSNVGKMLLLK